MLTITNQDFICLYIKITTMKKVIKLWFRMGNKSHLWIKRLIKFLILELTLTIKTLFRLNKEKEEKKLV
jgi:hypothetical protein